jgi:hypothetical protein
LQINKSVCRESKLLTNFITRKDNVNEVDAKLKREYVDFGYWEFAYSGQAVILAYLAGKIRKKKKSIITEKIEKIEREKSTIIDNIKRFLTETDIWDVVKKQRKDSKEQLTEDEENNLIVETFNLGFAYNLIERRTQLLTNRLEKIEKLRYKTPIKNIRIEAHTLIILVWSLAMRREEKSNYNDFEMIRTLLDWFAVNTEWKKFFEHIPIPDKDAIKTTYLRYMKPTNPRREMYKKTAFMFYMDCFQEVTPLLKSMFPNPFDYAKWEYENIYPLSAQIQKETK